VIGERVIGLTLTVEWLSRRP